MTIPARRWPGSTGLRMCCGRREGVVCNEAWPASCWTSRSDPPATETFLAAPVFDHPAGRYPAKTAPFDWKSSPRRSTLRTVVASQTRPRAVLTPRALSALATPDSDVTPAPRTSRMIGRTVRAKASARALVAAAPIGDPVWSKYSNALNYRGLRTV